MTAVSATAAAVAVADAAGSGDWLASSRENERIEIELRSSRMRLAEAADAERIRIERNLHDGAQQHLVTIALKLRMAQGKVSDSPDEVEALLDDAISDLLCATEELRELARGVHPTILTERGLSAAVQALANRCPIPVDLIELPRERLPQHVETTAYFIVAETVANAIKYANATRIVIRVTEHGDATSIDVRDDGDGGANPDRGTGLRGLVDRAAVLGGRIMVVSPIGSGTWIRASLKHPRPEIVTARR